LFALQLYVIHAPLGDRVVACAYALLEGKSANVYRDMLRALVQRCTDVGCAPHPAVVVTDFERAAMQATRDVLGGDVRCQGCFFHLTQSTWRKIQELGLSNVYKSSDSFRLLAGMLDGLAFLPLDRVSEGMTYVRSVMPPSAAPLVDYFDVNYVSGSVYVDDDDVVHRQPARFLPSTWSVHTATLSGGDRTNNNSEGWNSRLQHAIGHQHPSIWRLIEALQADAAEASSRILRHATGALSPKRQSRATKEYQLRLQRLCQDFICGHRPMDNFLRAVGHSIRHVMLE